MVPKGPSRPHILPNMSGEGHAQPHLEPLEPARSRSPLAAPQRHRGRGARVGPPGGGKDAAAGEAAEGLALRGGLPHRGAGHATDALRGLRPGTGALGHAGDAHGLLAHGVPELRGAPGLSLPGDLVDLLSIWTKVESNDIDI